MQAVWESICCWALLEALILEYYSQVILDGGSTEETTLLLGDNSAVPSGTNEILRRLQGPGAAWS